MGAASRRYRLHSSANRRSPGGNSAYRAAVVAHGGCIIRPASHGLGCQQADLSQNSFLLTKWYLDCVAESGDAVILYVADLQWNTLTLHYGSLIKVLDGKVASATSLRGSPAPRLDGKILSANLPGLEVEGTWEALRPPIRRTVFQNLQGSVDWHCLQPMSQVELLLRGKIRVNGLGYAECLTLNLLPWQLPLTSLNWGRYLSREDAIVWIDWQGREPKQAIVHNGEEHAASSITESEIVFADGRAQLQLDRGLVLRQGPLGDTVFPGVSRLAKLLPRSMLSVQERKWRSRAEFRTPAGASSGWAIHEVVKWKE